jgi:hypothetical protein
LFKLVSKRVEMRIEKEDRGGMREMEGENKYENIKIKREEVEEKEARGGTREMEGADKNEEGGKQRVLSQKQEEGRGEREEAREKRERERRDGEEREQRANDGEEGETHLGESIDRNCLRLGESGTEKDNGEKRRGRE